MSTLKIRLAAGAAALVVAASAGTAISSPALAAAPQLGLYYGVSGEVVDTGVLVPVSVENAGDEPATGVTVTFDAGDLRDVDITLADSEDPCELDGKVVTCELGPLGAQQLRNLLPLVLTSGKDAATGPAGVLKGTIRGFGQDGAEHSTSSDIEIAIAESGGDLAALAENLGTEDSPVGPGDVRPIKAGIQNVGAVPSKDWYVRVQLPTGSGIVEEYEDCEYQDWWSGEHPEGYVYGPNEVLCEVYDHPLGPGEGLLFYGDGDDALFHAAFGKSLRGPAKLDGNVRVGLIDELETARTPRIKAHKGSGKSFADAVAELRPSTRSANRREVNTENNWAYFDFWSKPNTYDFAVTAEPVSGEVGETVEIPYTVVNNGPSDGGANWKFRAPSGTLLVSDVPREDGPGCRFVDDEAQPVAELPEVGCGIGGEWPANASGYAGFKGTMKVRIISEPGDDGTLRVDGFMEPAEANPANNEVKLVINTGGNGGEGGGLPVTGASAAMAGGIGGGVVVLGAVLFLVARRRRIVTVSE